MWCLDGKYKSDCIRSLVHTRAATLSLLDSMPNSFSISTGRWIAQRARYDAQRARYDAQRARIRSDRNHSRAGLHTVRVYKVDNHSEASACATSSPCGVRVGALGSLALNRASVSRV